MKASPPLPQWPLWLSSKTLSKSPSIVNMRICVYSYTWVITRCHDVMRNARVNKFDRCTTPAPASLARVPRVSRTWERDRRRSDNWRALPGTDCRSNVPIWQLIAEKGDIFECLWAIPHVYVLGLYQFWPAKKALLFPYRELRYQTVGTTGEVYMHAVYPWLVRVVNC